MRTSSNVLAGARVLIADDHMLFRQGFKLLFQQMFPDSELIDASDAGQAYEIFETQPNMALAILDLTMSGMNGIMGVRRFASHRSAVPVIILSAHTDADEILECIKAGARAYIPKTVGESIVSHAINLVLAGENFIPSPAVRRIAPSGSQHGISNLAGLAVDNPLRQLTSRQCDTLALLIEGQSNKEAARQLGLLESTVKAHVKVILKKLGVQNRTQAAMIANDLGWPRPTRNQ